ncbi:HMCN1 [Symbiodinium sp. CCMP2592]|nr:HMCN1 [Symbiodinium sp. CCMP2592]
MVEVEEAAESECPLSKGDWQPWSECSASCSGVQRRVRTSWRCWEVVENKTAQRPCNEEVICDSQSCELGDWSSWKGCDGDMSCGQGASSSRFRRLLLPPGPTAPDCPSLVERRSCERPRPCPEECQKVLGHWAEWSSCSAMCDIGERWRIREMPPGAPDFLQARCRAFAQDLSYCEPDAGICPCKHFEGSKPCSARAAPSIRSRTAQHALMQDMLLNLHCPRERRHLIIRDERRRDEVLGALATNAAGSLVLSRHLPIMPASISGWELLSLGNESRRNDLRGRLTSAAQFPIEATFEGDGGDLERLRSCLSGWFASHLHLQSGQLNLTSPRLPQDFDRSLRLGLRLRIPCATQDADKRKPSCGRLQRAWRRIPLPSTAARHCIRHAEPRLAKWR